jgi:hypothetical protein
MMMVIIVIIIYSQSRPFYITTVAAAIRNVSIIKFNSSTGGDIYGKLYSTASTGRMNYKRKGFRSDK